MMITTTTMNHAQKSEHRKTLTQTACTYNNKKLSYRLETGRQQCTSL